MGRSGKASILVTALLAIVASLMPSAAFAFARPTLPQGNCGRVIYFDLHLGDAHDEGVATSAISEWENVRRETGLSAVDLRPGRSVNNPTIDVYITDAPGGNPGNRGAATCDGRWVELNTNILADDALLKSVMQHEWGHILGMHHVGQNDNDVSGAAGPPSMTTCISNAVARTRILSSDDRAGLMHKNGGNNPETMVANPGFERGTSAWYETGTGPLDLVTANSAQGNYSGRFLPASEIDPVAVKTAYSAANLTRVHGIAWHRAYNSGASGSIRLELLVRQVNYAGNPGCVYAVDRDFNTVLSRGPWLLKLANEFATDNTNRLASLASRYQISEGDGTEVQVRLFGRVYSGSALTFVQLDNLSIRDFEN